MPFTSLKPLGLATLLLAVLSVPAGGVNPHLDPLLVKGGCGTCHEGHGASGSPMLPTPQAELCLSCHDSEISESAQLRSGMISADAQPQLLSEVLNAPHTHPMTQEAFSRSEPDVVTCTSCHTPHRGKAEGSRRPEGQASLKLSSRDASQFEYELCQSCHGSQGVNTQDLGDISRLTSPNSRSYHPIQVPTQESAPSIKPEFGGKEINCTDCHGSNSQTGPAGVHGSEVPFILVAGYSTTDGGKESREQYALCYRCHRRPEVLDSPVFPLHRLHVVEERASCATCHSAHGSVENRALIRFGEETSIGGIAPSGAANRLAFVSESPGAGSCYLTCHGVDHGPKTYGGGGSDFEILDAFGMEPGDGLTLTPDFPERSRRRGPEDQKDIQR